MADTGQSAVDAGRSSLGSWRSEPEAPESETIGPVSCSSTTTDDRDAPTGDESTPSADVESTSSADVESTIERGTEFGPGGSGVGFGTAGTMLVRQLDEASSDDRRP